jgi:TPR repeat protein
MYNYGRYCKDIEHNYDQMKQYYLMAIEREYVKAMFELGFYYDQHERNLELAKKYLMRSLKTNADQALIELSRYYRNRPVAFYKLLIEAVESSIGDDQSQTLIQNRISILLEQYRSVNAFQNKIRVFRRLGNYGHCAVCLEEEVLLVMMDCGHEICVSCYDPEMRCYLRCTT